MEIGQAKMIPAQKERALTKWEEWRAVILFVAIIIGSSVAIWHVPLLQPVTLPILLGVGLFFDLVSLMARISTAITGRYSSGFFIVGFVFYFWAWLAFPHSVLLGQADGLLVLWMRKALDLVSLALVHLLIHVSYGRGEDSSGPKINTKQDASEQPTVLPKSSDE